MSSPIIIDPLSATTLRVLPKFNQTELASATAFTVLWEAQPFLITNWHVVTGRDPDTGLCLDKKHGAIPNTLSVRFHLKGNLGAWNVIDLPLINNEGEPLWLEHPMGKAMDVVAIPISTVQGIEVYPLDLKLADVDMVLSPAMPVSVIGYPLGLAAGKSWPIWKTGHIASDPDLDYEPGRPAFLIDATTRSGMSGAPVVVRLDSYQRRNGSQVLAGGTTTKFVGVYAGRIHEDSEIGRVWRPFVLQEVFRRKLIFDDSTRRAVPGRMTACPCGSGKRYKECCGSAL